MRIAIVVAGGSGLRMGSDIPKQFLPVVGEPILMHTLKRFNEYDKDMNLVLVLPSIQIEYWKTLCDKYSFDLPHEIVVGGETRYHSVRNGLEYIKKNKRDISLIAIHDGVRPLVSVDTLSRCFVEAAKYGSAIPVMPAIESIRMIDETDGERSYAVDRRRVMLVQTPQVFTSEVVMKSYDLGYRETFTDDASVCEAAGYTMHLSQGNKENVKITTPDDMIYAEMIMKKRV